ncbi:MAG TPA: biopolymer transporter ExbD [Candidatus Limnocylindria bacterium]|nr:biopolymer transporter ExbD [Candidatus Limnocylindria bacterium]
MNGSGYSSAWRSQGTIRTARLKKPRIEIIPLIDVMFFLLASFMLVSLSMQKASTRTMDLAVAGTAKDDFQPSAINIVVAGSGRFYLGTNEVSGRQLDAALAVARQASGQTPILVTSGRDTAYSEVERALAHVRGAGFQRVAFVTRPAERMDPR